MAGQLKLTALTNILKRAISNFILLLAPFFQKQRNIFLSYDLEI